MARTRIKEAYYKPSAGEWIQPVPRGYRMSCCDCGLVHRIDFRVIKWAGGKRTKAQFRVFRDNRSTAMVRRHMKKSKGS